MSERKIGRGRPSKLTPQTSARLAALLIAGATTVEAAREIGVDRRTVADWRSRAWSRAPADQPYVQLERMIQRGRLAAAEIGPGRVDEPVALMPLDDLLSDLDAGF